MPPVRSISVLIPTWQGAEFLERVLAALAGQRCKIPWDLTVVDSGSTDGTLAILAGWRGRFPRPFELFSIHKVEFDHGDTRNLLVSRTQGELCVFLTQDAIPSSPDWLALLAKNFEDERVGAAYCQNLARPSASVLTRVFSEHDPGYMPGRREVRLPPPAEYAKLDAQARRVLYNFNDVASAVRRALWERHPFPRAGFGEDVLMARALLEAGYTVVYDDKATVEHSHDYDAKEMRSRAEIDGRFNAEWLDRICVGSKRDAAALTDRQLELDREALHDAGVQRSDFDRELERARELRTAAFEGLWAGGQSRRRFAPTRMLEKSALHVLFVVHGFPPDTWAGTEVYTLELAKALERRGHRCTILARAPAPPAANGKAGGKAGPADFSLREERFEGLTVWRMVNRLDHQSIRETYDQPRAAAAFRELLARVRPDVVHFQHLIHTSASLVQVAKDRGLPTVLHCHDYWALCARVQLIRPDGVRCEKNMGSGCFLCIKERGLPHIPRLAQLDAAAGPLLDALGRGLRGTRRLGQESRRKWEGFADLRARQDFVLGAFAAADLRISPSRFLRDKLLASGAFDPHTLVYSDNGLRTDNVKALEKRPDPQGRVRFGFVGSLVWYKGGRVLVEAMQLLAGTKAVLNVYGAFDPDNDPHHAELARLAGPNVEFKGRFDNQHLSGVHAEIDVLVVPSLWYENSPITIHEAYLTHTPVVTASVGGMAEYVREGVDGLHFTVGDATDLARVLRRFVDEPDLRQRLSRDFMRVKTVDENAAECEFRYRALCCRVRTPAASVLLDYRGIDTAERIGSVQQQGIDMVLLRPGGAAVEYDISAAGPGQREIAVDVYALGGEARVELGGRALVDGEELGRVESFRSGGEDGTRTVRFVTALRPGARRLRMESGSHARGPFLRIKRVRVSECGVEPARTGGAR